MAINVNVPDQHQITQAACHLKFLLISAIFFYHGTPGLLFHLPFPLLWHKILFQKQPLLSTFVHESAFRTHKRSALSHKHSYSRAECFQTLGKVELFRKKRTGPIFPVTKREQRMFHAVWEAGFSSTATKKMAIERNSLIIWSWFVCVRPGSEENLAWSEVSPHFLRWNTDSYSLSGLKKGVLLPSIYCCIEDRNVLSVSGRNRWMKKSLRGHTHTHTLYHTMRGTGMVTRDIREHDREKV